MPIQIPNDLPAAEVLQSENIFVMPENRATTQDIRPLEIVLLNLMPTKIATETQLSRVLGNTPLQVKLELMHTTSHRSKNTPQDHLLNFYKSFDELKHRKFDGMVITGAPVELMDFEDVDYWPELCEQRIALRLKLFAGARKRGFITTTVFKNTPCRKSFLACMSTKPIINGPFYFVASMIPSGYPIPATPPLNGKMWKRYPA